MRISSKKKGGIQACQPKKSIPLPSSWSTEVKRFLPFPLNRTPKNVQCNVIHNQVHTYKLYTWVKVEEKKRFWRKLVSHFGTLWKSNSNYLSCLTCHHCLSTNIQNEDVFGVVGRERDIRRRKLNGWNLFKFMPIQQWKRE